MIKSDYLEDTQIVIIGAGAIGAALTYRLSQAGAQVTTVERRYPGSGITGNSFAWVNAWDKPPKHYTKLNNQSIRDHVELADELNGSWLRLEGGLHWEHANEAGRVKNLRDNIRQLRDWGTRVDKATPEEIMRDLEPDLWIDPNLVDEVYFVPKEGVIDPVSMAHSILHAGITRHGAKFIKGTVVGFKGAKGSVSGVVLEDGSELPADIVINACGNEADKVAALAGAYIPLAPTTGMTVSTPPAPVCLKRCCHSPEANMRPDGAGRLIIRNRDCDTWVEAGKIPAVDSELVNGIMDRARKILPNITEIPAESVRVGVRAIPADAISIVGFDPQVVGFYTVVTHSGITLSARLALLVTEDLTGGDVAELQPYRPSRFTRP